MTPEELKDFAKQEYGNGIFNESQFEKDYRGFADTKRVINRFLKSDKIEEKAVINSVIVTLNIFGKSKVNRVFRHLLDDVQFSVIKAVLMFLRQYDFSIGQDVYPNRIMVDILRDMSHRYRIGEHHVAQ